MFRRALMPFVSTLVESESSLEVDQFYEGANALQLQPELIPVAVGSSKWKVLAFVVINQSLIYLGDLCKLFVIISLMLMQCSSRREVFTQKQP